MKAVMGKRETAIMAVCMLLGSSAAGEYHVWAANEGSSSVHTYDLQGITVEAARPEWEEKLSPGTVTVIRPEEFKGEQKTLPDMLREVPGVHVREVNGKGQYTTVTVRGSTAAQVGVFVDGVLTNLGGDAAVDISAIPVKNVERVEVYRGYIPSRFGGTFIGGVINIVTKKPDKPHVALELGKSSYGGKSVAGEVTAALGDGTLLISGSYESSQGDFKYDNYAAERYIPYQKKLIDANQKLIDEFNVNMVEQYKNYLGLSPKEIAEYKVNPNRWLSFVRNTGEDGFVEYYKNTYRQAKKVDELRVGRFRAQMEELGYKQKYLDGGYTERNWIDGAMADWDEEIGRLGIIQAGDKEKIRNQYVKDNAGPEAESAKNTADPDKSSTMAGYKKNKEQAQKKLDQAEQKARWRKYNDYRNSSALVKWQNQNWMVKGAWNQIDRYMPDSVWGGDFGNAVPANMVDLEDVYVYDSRRQRLTNTELMVQNRQQNGNLEWGWMADYLRQNKRYRAEHINRFPNVTDPYTSTTPMLEWSQYRSNKYNVQIDGSYKLSERSMLDFQANYSHEKLDIDGDKLDESINENGNNLMGQMRNKYEQDILNLQIQNTINLDQKGTFQLTPSVRYNQSKITGYSNGSRFSGGVYSWIHPKDSQTNGKATWQLALKKQFNDHFTMRMTGGTYYRLLNMYEIAGDGAGIVPATRDGKHAVFPLPEEGKQFDVSAMWQGSLLKAQNSTTLTYFWRDSENMLQLVRNGFYHWSYDNDNKAKVHGVEFQSNFSWDKFDLDLRAAYTKSHAQRRNSAFGMDYSDIWTTYLPEWEGNVRLTYRPTKNLDLFGEVHYTDEYFTSSAKDSRGGELAYISGKPVTSLTVINVGLKWRPMSAWQFAFGCNDLFNKGPEQKIRARDAVFGEGYINPEFPLQGRTYYVTARYEF